MRGTPILPDYPKVVLDGSAVVIHYENGNEKYGAMNLIRR